MRKILYICNSKRPCLAFLIAILLIVGIEIAFSSLLPAKYFSHEVDSILYQVKTKHIKADYILLGDSVGRQVLNDYENDSKFSMLATNQAIEMTGQYFLIKRFLNNNPPPKAVIFSGLPSLLDKNLDQQYTENYVLRTFNNFDEITELLAVKKNATIAAKALFYKLFPSFKYRLHLQKRILGITNANIYTGEGKASASTAPKQFSADYIIKKFQKKKSSLYHFRKMIEFLSNKGIHFYYIPVPIKKTLPTNQLEKKYKDLFEVLATWQNEGLKITFYDNIIEYPEHFFKDGAHLNEEGLVEAKGYIDGFVKSSISF